jgi:hypothetical protein
MEVKASVAVAAASTLILVVFLMLLIQLPAHSLALANQVASHFFCVEKLAGALLYHIRGKQSRYSNYIITLLKPLRLKNI